MTIFRCDRLKAADVELTFVSSNEPDTIGVEYAFQGNCLFDLRMDSAGTTSILFDEIENAEFPLSDLRELIERGEDELKKWHARLSEPGEMWAKE
jgi:hypothetical protein